MKNKILYLSVLTAVFSIFSASFNSADAQTTRRKKTTMARPVVSTTQQPTSERNPEYLDGNQIVLGEVPQNEPTITTVNPENTLQTSETTENGATVKELTERIKLLESNKTNAYDEKQKRLLLNLDILSRAESRAESLRKQLFEMIEKESGVQTRLEQIQYDARPETIARSTAFVGSMRPEELREQRQKSLEAEKRNLESLMRQIQTSRASLEENVQRADFLVEKVRLKLDKDIDDALAEDKEEQ